MADEPTNRGRRLGVPVPPGRIPETAPPPPRMFRTGAFPSPPEKVRAARKWEPMRAAPSQACWVAPRLDTWNNREYGDCVTAEECFSKGAWTGHHFIPASECVRWANAHGFLNGATLIDVLEAMQTDGLRDDQGIERKDGPHFVVDASNESNLKTAVATGPVKLGMASSCLPRDAGGKQGWAAKGECRPGYLDHSTTCAGYGPAGYLAQQYGFPLPSAFRADEPAYAYFTWGTIGIVDYSWLRSSTDEWWLRNPTTVGEQPEPPPPPPPPPPPGPSPHPLLDFLLCVVSAVRSGKGFWDAVGGCLIARSEHDLHLIVNALAGREGGHHCGSLADRLDTHVVDWLHGRGTLTADQLVDVMLGLDLAAVEPFVRVLQGWQMQMGGAIPKLPGIAPGRRGR